ncbi:NUDIX domain-containing protein [Lichenicoccus sp.]|uniref:NUDIX hydrolase n=1 Tax=Lichenicoccus sp. TaxID=2781899 RepID=UPI003D12B052
MPRFARAVPDGENRERVSCLDCGHVFYENPKIVVGAVVAHAGRILLCRRAIEPRRGFWTLPAGYLELHETPAEGAAREALEEAGARIVIDGILAIYSISRIAQVQIIHRARFAGSGEPSIEAGEESLEVGLFAFDDLPVEDIAFPTVHWAIEAYRRIGDAPLAAPAGNPPQDPRGEGALPGRGALQDAVA